LTGTGFLLLGFAAVKPEGNSEGNRARVSGYSTNRRMPSVSERVLTLISNLVRQALMRR
jgi:hypothetical protein